MKRLDKIMQREMTRREFLGALGLGIVSIVGAGSVLRLLFGKSSEGRHGNNTYGSSAYGGEKK